jgi:Transposase, Mutator family
VEETLNAMLDAEADCLCRAERYERTGARKDTRAGSYQPQLHTQVGQVPKLRRRLSIKLCLRDKSSGLLKTRLEQGIELRNSRGEAACNGSPSTILQ